MVHVSAVSHPGVGPLDEDVLLGQEKLRSRRDAPRPRTATGFDTRHVARADRVMRDEGRP